MISEKDILRKKFSEDSDKYFKVSLFKEMGFVRKLCPSCSYYFWTLDPDRITCAEEPCQEYDFFGDPPTNARYSFSEAWKKISDFFAKNGHARIPRYPVVCRWRPDLYFTIASIVDFQRIESGKVVFELPGNPLIIPQMCLRFSDIGNVGVTGRHFTSFCMIGQVALANKQGYWKDRCIDLDFHLLTDVFGIPKEQPVFKEDVWLGPGAFGYSLEYCARGLELGNAVFTAFEGTSSSYREYPEGIVDMGGGLDRLVWLSQGTPTAYEAVFGEAYRKIAESIGFHLSNDELPFFEKYFKLAGSLDVENFRGEENFGASLMDRVSPKNPEEFRKKIEIIRALSSILDHTRTLAFAISDGALPSNVGGGYNLRVIFRRAYDFAQELNLRLSLADVAILHAESLKEMYPELLEHGEDIKTIFAVEESKYALTKKRASVIVESLKKKKQAIGTEQLIQLYDSEGITPEALVRAGLNAQVPPDFYSHVTEKHMIQRHEEAKKTSYDVSGLPPTNLLFYLDRDQFDFEAKVLRRIGGNFLVLDSTAFYARSGGQEPDHGTIGDLRVGEVIKINNVVLHEILGGGELPKDGEIVHGHVDQKRRSLIMRHHTATHIVNGAARKFLGPWVWQHSAFKDEDMARLDITHFAHLTRDQVLDIERASNKVVRRNLPVTITWVPRNKAEEMYGFRLYQGGVVPNKELRIVNIEGWDVEACGGTHCSRTGDVGLIKIIKAERVQDGVERLEFVAGEAAVNYVEKLEGALIESGGLLKAPMEKVPASLAHLVQSEEIATRNSKQLSKRLAELMVDQVIQKATKPRDDLLLYVDYGVREALDLGSEYYLYLGDSLSKKEPKIVYVALFREAGKTRIMTFSGSEAQRNRAKAGDIMKQIASFTGGSGGGDARFAQGGTQGDIAPEKLAGLEEFISDSLSKKS